MGDLGEKAFVRRLLRRLRPDHRLLTGHGNDAAALDLHHGVGRIAFNIDRAARPVVISHGWAGLGAWGRLAVTANCSDLLAVGAEPAAFMVSVSGPVSWPAAQVEEIVLGCQEECERRRRERRRRVRLVAAACARRRRCR
jgi:thiamine-monophosphate kinase